MAIFHSELYVHALHRKTRMVVILPVAYGSRDPVWDPEVPMKTAVLLHGHNCLETEWLNFSTIVDFATKYKMAILCPNLENNFAIDDVRLNRRYEEMILELLDLARKIFPLSKAREDTVIGGVSMGGYAAIRVGLRHPEIFGGVISYSSALITDKMMEREAHISNHAAPDTYYQYYFGDPQKIEMSDFNPKFLARRQKEAGVKLPGVYVICGDQDGMLKESVELHATFEELGYRTNLLIGPGGHNWAFWNSTLDRSFEWIWQNTEKG